MYSSGMETGSKTRIAVEYTALRENRLSDTDWGGISRAGGQRERTVPGSHGKKGMAAQYRAWGGEANSNLPQSRTHGSHPLAHVRLVDACYPRYTDFFFLFAN